MKNKFPTVPTFKDFTFFSGTESFPGDSDGEGQVSLAICSPWGCKELDTTESLINNKRQNNDSLAIKQSQRL